MKTKLLALGALFASLGLSVQGQTPVDKTPVLHLSFDKVSGTTAGSVVTNDGTGGWGMNGTLNGGATIVPGGKFGNALQVTGVNSPDASVRIPNAVVPLNVTAGSAWTVSCWIKTTTQGGTWMYQGNGGWAANYTTFFMAVNNGSTGNNGHAAGGVRYGQGWQQGTTVVDDGNWHHIVFTFDGTNKVQYIDGVVDTWVANGWAVGTGDGGVGNQFWIGGGGTGQGDGQVCLNGLIDEAYVFNQALNQTDVQGLFSANALPIVPVEVAVNPASGYRGTSRTITVTATVTPGAGTVTNVTANMSALGLSAAANLVLSSGNIFTNSFTVSSTTAVGAYNLPVTAKTTASPFIGSAGGTYTVVARPPTNAVIVTQVSNVSAFEYTETSFRFVTTNDAPNDAPFPMAYSWYTNNVLVSTNAMGPNYTFLNTPADNGMQVYAIARVADANFSSIAVTSAVVTLTVNPGSIVYTNGLKQEIFAGATRAGVEIGDVAPGVISYIPNADSAGGFGDNTSRRYSGYFIPPTNDSYVFFVASDDDCDLFLSTDSSPANKRLIAKEDGWSATDNWQTAGGGGSIVSQKRSDQWTNSVGTAPYATGIPLVAGQKYYLESVMHNGGGGDNWGITYVTMSELLLDPSVPVSGTASRIAATNLNVALVTWPGTNIVWALQPVATNVFEGNTATFTARATSDSEMSLAYQWYVNGTPSGADSPILSLPFASMSLNGAQIKVVASTRFGGLSTTSSVVTLTIQQAVLEVGYAKEEKWLGLTTRTTVRNGTAGNPTFTIAMPAFAQGVGNPGGQGDFAMRLSGFFIPATSGNYTFFIDSDDDSDLFLSTDNTPGNRRLIAQEAGWSGEWNWNTAGGGGTVATQKRSDQWTTNSETPYANGISLVAGQRYYMEVDHHNGAAGGTHVGVYYKIATDPDPANGTLPNTVGNRIAINAPRSAYVAFTQQPTNVTVNPMGFVNLSVAGTTDSTMPVSSILTGNEATRTNNFLIYRWTKNGTPIPGATSSSLLFGPLLPSDNGAQIVCQIRSLGYSDNALNPIWSNSQPATITVSGQAVFETGVAQVQWWTNTTRDALEDGSVGRPATFVYSTPKLVAPSTSQYDSYGNVVSCWLTPTVSGNYSFFLNANDDADVFLSTDSNPLNKVMICREPGTSGGVLSWLGGDLFNQRYSDQFVNPVTGTQLYPSGVPLTAGQKYYLEIVHRDNTGGDYLALTYTMFGEPTPINGTDSALTGNLIGFYAPRVPWVAFVQQPQAQSAVSGANPVTFSVQGTNAPSTIVVGDTGNPQPWFANPTYLQYQWYKNGTPIPGANSSTYTLNPVLPSDNNAQFVVGIRTLGYANDALSPIYSNSTPAVLTVITDNVPPAISYAATFVNTNQNPEQYIVNVTFNEWMDATTLSNAFNYTIAGSTITNVSVAGDHRTVQLLVTAPPTLPLNVTVSGVKDLSGNTIVASSPAAINPEKLTFSDIGSVGSDPAYPSFAWVTGVGGYIISAQGHDIWDAADGFNFAWESKSGDFDAVVRSVSQTKTANSAKAGLMVREDLSPSSRNWDVVNNPASADGIMAVDGSGFGANNVECNYRGTNGTGTASWKSAGTIVPRYPNAWVRLKRTGTLLEAFSSSNRVDWVRLAGYDTATNLSGALPAQVFLGICTTAHNNDPIGGPPPPPFRFYNTAEYAGYTSSFVPSAPAATLSVSVSGSNLNISWTPVGGTLQASPALGGAGVNWQNVTTSNPATVPIGPDARFFRVLSP